MRLLLDQNLARRLVRDLSDRFPESTHVHDLGLERASDAEIWALARSGGFTIVSKDDDFRQRSFLLGAPPKVIWVRLGNCTTREVADLLRASATGLHAFEADPDAALFAITRQSHATR